MEFAAKPFRKLKIAADIFIITLGAGVYAFAVAALLEPYGIVPGGVTGLSMLICHIFPVLPLGATILAVNTPLFIMAWRFLGRQFVLYTAYGTVAASVLIDIADGLVPAVEIDPMLAGVFGGLLMGGGLGMVFMRGATTGGSDIVAKLIKLLLPSVQMGKLILAFDGVVCLLSGVVFGSVNNMLYAAITLFISSRALDGILYGLNIERVAYIVTERPEEIARAIGTEMQRGATLLHGEGAFSGNPKKLILCAVKRQQIAILKDLVKQMDENAFLILSEASEVYGEGFGRIRNI